jgi:hypothetical protein
LAALALVSAAIGAVGSIASGVAQKNAADYQAKQQEMQGNEDFAASQRDAEAKRRESKIVQSRQQALAAASGAGATDPTIVRLMTQTAGQGEYNAQTALYSGEQQKRGLYDAAKATRMSGNASLLGSFISGAGTLVKGVSSAGIFG